MAETMHNLDWLFSLGVIFFLLSAWGIGANDVANSYSTSVSSRSLTLIQAGVLATITEFVGAMALGQGVTSTIRNGIFSIEPFIDSPGVLILAMVVAEAGSAFWLTLCTKMGFPVSTTQSLVGALVGVGIALDIQVNWGWSKGSVSQIAASWAIAPAISCGFGILIMMSIKVLVFWQRDPLKAALRVISFYYALTAGILTLFIVISGGHGIPSLEEMGAGKATSIVLGVFFGIWAVAAVFFVPYYYRKLVREDRRLRVWHIPKGPMLWKDDYSLYWPGNEQTDIVPDYYKTHFLAPTDAENTETVVKNEHPKVDEITKVSTDSNDAAVQIINPKLSDVKQKNKKDLENIENLPWIHPKRIFSTVKLLFTYGITRDVLHHQSRGLEHIHNRAPVFDNKIEHLWTTAQILSAMIMSVAHGANDISNAIGPFTTTYQTWKTGEASATTPTPEWIKAVGGLTLGVGFWTYGYHIMRVLGNKITKHSPTRGFSMELATATTVLLASELELPVSTTQCITGAIVGVALTNFDLKSINWAQLGWIVVGWILTVPVAGLVAGLLMAMAMNAPHWGT